MPWPIWSNARWRLATWNTCQGKTGGCWISLRTGTPAMQDDMGARLMPAILRTLGEEVAAMPALDRFNRLEQLGWLPFAEEWAELRRIRNEFAHEYPATAQERLERLQLALTSARRLLEILAILDGKIHQRFPKLGESSQGDRRGLDWSETNPFASLHRREESG